MSLVINTNYAATTASNNLSSANGLLQKSLNRLSSGLKINSPAEDAGGLAVSMKLAATARRSGAVATNIANTVSMLQTQDGVLKVAGKILDRVSELKTLYTDPTKNSNDKAIYDREFTALAAQLTSLSSEKFNGNALFGTTSSYSVPVTEDGSTTSQVSLAAVNLLQASAGSPGGVVTNFTLASLGTANFTATAPGVLTYTAGTETVTITNANAGPFGSDHIHTDDPANTVYDGSNWTNVSASHSNATTTVTGATLSLLGSLNPVNFTFTTSATPGANTNTGNVAAATSLASVSLTTITSALQDIATARATNGSLQARLGYASELVTVNKANIEQANSRIIDVDVAEESTQLARYNTLVQAGTAMLAQANTSANNALRLLQ